MSHNISRTITSIALTLACLLFGSRTTEAGPAPRPAAVEPKVGEAAPQAPSSARAPMVLVATHRPTDRLEIDPYDQDGKLLPAAHRAISHFLRCPVTNRTKLVHPGLVAAMFQVSRDYPGKPIIVVSGVRWRGRGGESGSSPHWRGRAVDLRVPGMSSHRLSRTLWKTYDGIAVGNYPSYGFVHIDVRSKPVRWTQRAGVNSYSLHKAEEVGRLAAIPTEFPPSPRPAQLAVVAR
jgi:uncharacterized protein YcbK (DUF882 family)